MIFGQLHIGFAVAAVFVATFTLLYIFTSVGQISDNCKVNPAQDICKALSGVGFPLIVVLLLIGGLILVISTVGYILLTA